jgi:hypothetical protein
MKMSRSSGILLHPSSLPETSGIGTIGAQAYKFVDWLKSAKQSIWQILPLGPTGYGDSPYASFSTYAGNPLLIDLDTLCMGHPVFELGSMFNALIGYSELDHPNTERFFGYTFETAEKFWHLALPAYLGTDDEQICQSVAEKAMIVGYTRMFRRAVLNGDSPMNPAKRARCKEMLAKLLKNVDTLVF